jgi:hypothetical protein
LKIIQLKTFQAAAATLGTCPFPMALSLSILEANPFAAPNVSGAGMSIRVLALHSPAIDRI